ncbi:hypothetical protein Dimus_019077, partial [Dionaea muscipula]
HIDGSVQMDLKMMIMRVFWRLGLTAGAWFILMEEQEEVAPGGVVGQLHHIYVES